MRGEKVKIPEKHCHIGVKLHNRFDIEVIDDKSGEVVQRAQAENVILDQAWEWIVGFKTTNPTSGYGWNYNISVGNGTGSVSSSDTQLINHLRSERAYFHYSKFDDTKNIYTYTTLATISSSVLVNRTITEIGIATNNGLLMTHAMIRDMTGNRISIAKGDNESIKIYSTVFLHLNIPEDVVLVNTSNGSSEVGDYLLLDALVGRYNYNGAPRALNITEEEMYTHINYSVSTTQKFVDISYNLQKKTSTLAFRRYLSNENNRTGGRRSFVILGSNYPVMYVYFDNVNSWNTAHRVTDTLGLYDGTTRNYSLRYSPYVGTPKIRANGKDILSKTRNMPYYNTTDTENILCYFKTVRVPALPYPANNNSTPLTKNGSQFILCQSSMFLDGGGITSIDEAHATIFENVLCKAITLQQFSGSSISKVLCSNDMITWTNIVKLNNRFAINGENQHYRYWKFLTSSNTAVLFVIYEVPSNLSKNVYIDGTPPMGSTLEAEYDTPVISKDPSHVLDFSLIFSFGEYKEVM